MLRGKGCEACGGFGGLAEVERARGAVEAGAFGQRHSHAYYEYIYTPPPTIPPLPLSFCSKDTPIQSNAPKNFYNPIKNASLSQRPPIPLTNYSVPPPATFSALLVARPLPLATAFSTFSRRATKSSKLNSPAPTATY